MEILASARQPRLAMLDPQADAVTGPKEVISTAQLDTILRLVAGEGGKTSATLQQNKPELAAPRDLLKPQDTGVLRSWLESLRLDSSFADSVDTLYSQVEQAVTKELSLRSDEQRDPGFDISGYSNRMTALLVQAIVLMSSLRTADTELSTQLSLVSFEAVKFTAAAMEREGMAALSSSISGAAFQFAVTGVGAKTSLDGLQQQRSALKFNGSKVNNATKELGGMQDALKRPNVASMGSQADSLNKVDLKPNAQVKPGSAGTDSVENLRSAGANSGSRDIELAPSNKQFSEEHTAALGNPSNGLSAQQLDESMALELNRLSGQGRYAVGQAIMQSSHAVNSMAMAGGTFAAALERSDQQISQASSRVADNASQETRESSRKSDTIIQDLIRMVDAVNQSRSAAMGAIAGNIRA
ncbi:MAG: IpaC/SipC family type III secretion system effector [Plesiomonas sp.]|uniref:IpaC/SipC family type III secretion system effector n=1 Tax=Plesiomonas sp. TaxID=2486279 RepID=UPI003F3F4B30